MGKNSAITIVPTITAMTTIISGSISEVSAGRVTQTGPPKQLVWMG